MHYHCEVWIPENRDVKDQIQDILAPYEEGLNIEFVNIEKEYRKKYETESCERIKTTTGKLLSPYDKCFCVRIPGEIETHTAIPEEFQRVTISFKKLYSTFEEFVKEYAGYEYDESEEAYGYWINPLALWDWYVIGGRWTGSHDGYDPTEDRQNYKTCFLCGGTGFRNDALGRKAREEDPSYTCNGCGTYNREIKKWEHGKFGAGLKLCGEFKPHAEDVASVDNVKPDLTCYTLIVKGQVFETRKWNDKKKKWENTDFDGNVKKKLEELKIKTGYLVTVDCHT